MAVSNDPIQKSDYAGKENGKDLGSQSRTGTR